MVNCRIHFCKATFTENSSYFHTGIYLPVKTEFNVFDRTDNILHNYIIAQYKMIGPR